MSNPVDFSRRGHVLIECRFLPSDSSWPWAWASTTSQWYAILLGIALCPDHLLLSGGRREARGTAITVLPLGTPRLGSIHPSEGARDMPPPAAADVPTSLFGSANAQFQIPAPPCGWIDYVPLLAKCIKRRPILALSPSSQSFTALQHYFTLHRLRSLQSPRHHVCQQDHHSRRPFWQGVPRPGKTIPRSLTCQGSTSQIVSILMIFSTMQY